MESGPVQYIFVLMASLSAHLEDVLWFSTRKDVAPAAVVSPLVGLLLLIALIRPVRKELHAACSYAIAGRTERHRGMQAPLP
jgi:hypothetical protein